ncbi:hypothetical protein MMC10_006064 [Thelotrema lepadinum]|nr:hypothetical protein [Thelotrema lepadinum]
MDSLTPSHTAPHNTQRPMKVTRRVILHLSDEAGTGNAPAYFLRYIDVALLSKWSYESDGPASSLCPRKEKYNNGSEAEVQQMLKQAKPLRSGTSYARLAFGLQTTISQRHVNTAFEVRNVPCFSSTNAQAIPLPQHFITDSLKQAILCYFFIDLSTLNGPPEDALDLFASDKVPLFSRLQEVSVKELGIRISTTLFLWLTIYCMVRMFYNILASATVWFGWYEVKDWRPPFGALSEAWSIRQYWGWVSLLALPLFTSEILLTSNLLPNSNFWHQMFRQFLTCPATWFTHDVLRLHRHGPLPRYIKLLMVFTLSGLLHHYTDITCGMTVAESGSLTFFVTQAIGIMVEDAIQALWGYYKHWRGHRKGEDERLREWEKRLGWIWTLAFLVWSTPMWSYPAIRRQTGKAKDAVLPFSVLRTVLTKSYAD